MYFCQLWANKLSDVCICDLQGFRKSEMLSVKRKEEWQTLWLNSLSDFLQSDSEPFLLTEQLITWADIFFEFFASLQHF